MLAAAGKTVLISDYFEYYRLAAYLTRYTIAADCGDDGRRRASRIFSRRNITRGSKAAFSKPFGKLFTKDLRIYVYPLRIRRRAN